jgi:hypothetical protein
LSCVRLGRAMFHLTDPMLGVQSSERAPIATAFPLSRALEPLGYAAKLFPDL